MTAPRPGRELCLCNSCQLWDTGRNASGAAQLECDLIATATIEPHERMPDGLAEMD